MIDTKRSEIQTQESSIDEIEHALQAVQNYGLRTDPQTVSLTVMHPSDTLKNDLMKVLVYAPAVWITMPLEGAEKTNDVVYYGFFSPAAKAHDLLELGFQGSEQEIEAQLLYGVDVRFEPPGLSITNTLNAESSWKVGDKRRLEPVFSKNLNPTPRPPLKLQFSSGLVVVAAQWAPLSRGTSRGTHIDETSPRNCPPRGFPGGDVTLY